MMKYDPSILQSVTAANMVNLALELHKELREYHKEKMAMLKDEYDSAFKIKEEAVQKMAAQQQQMAQASQR